MHRWLIEEIAGVVDLRRVFGRTATARGLAPAPLSPWRVERDCGQGLLLSFTNIPQESAFDVAMRLKQAIDREPATQHRRSCFRVPTL
jgi:hypothetical protein